MTSKYMCVLNLIGTLSRMISEVSLDALGSRSSDTSTALL